MDDNELYVKQLKTVVVGILALIALGIGSCQTTNYQIRKMVETGAHPKVAQCAVGGVSCDNLFLIELEEHRAGQSGE